MLSDQTPGGEPLCNTAALWVASRRLPGTSRGVAVLWPLYPPHGTDAMGKTLRWVVLFEHENEHEHDFESPCESKVRQSSTGHSRAADLMAPDSRRRCASISARPVTSGAALPPKPLSPSADWPNHRSSQQSTASQFRRHSP
jgi:hypothetical protein